MNEKEEQRTKKEEERTKKEEERTKKEEERTKKEEERKRQKEDQMIRIYEGLVLESFPNGMFRVLIENEKKEKEIILGFISGKIRCKSIRILLGDNVKVEVNQYDRTKGRITSRIDKKASSKREEKKRRKEERRQEREEKELRREAEEKKRKK
uniref:translation initiation factor 1 n=1 Tax=Anarthria humilis TaxID=198286 RepID=UPI001F12E0D1|nr:translation initiation factor 1 [Anarthria humilis]ULQ64132.1 translation initiation factor 1 [Anarthria humilis]